MPLFRQLDVPSEVRFAFPAAPVALRATLGPGYAGGRAWWMIDTAALEAAMRAGPYTTKKDAVEAGLKLLARQAAYREILKWEGKLHWDGDGEVDAVPTLTTAKPGSARRHEVDEPAAKFTPCRPI